MTCSARRSPASRALGALLVVALALAVGGCRQAPRAGDAATSSKIASLLPADLALEFLQQIKSQPGRSLLAGEAIIPPCRFTDKGTWSAGEYRKLTGQRAPTFVTAHQHWIVFKIEAPDGRDFLPADLERSVAWIYSLRTPRSARTVFGTTDHCVIGPTSEPPRKVVEALAALGVALSPEYGYIVR
jgi:hypothetical protein